MSNRFHRALGSWSAMRNYLENDMLATSLKGRIRYSCTTFPQMGSDCRFGIHVDGQPVKYFSGENIAGSVYRREWPFDKRRYWDGYLHVRFNVPVAERQEYDDQEFAAALAEYRNSDISASLASENPIVRMFAVLDRRTGKRTLARIVDGVSEQPEWLQYFYRLRLTAEGLREQRLPRTKSNETED